MFGKELHSHYICLNTTPNNTSSKTESLGVTEAKNLKNLGMYGVVIGMFAASLKLQQDHPALLQQPKHQFHELPKFFLKVYL